MDEVIKGITAGANWIIAHKEFIIGTYTAAVTLASAIIKWLPTIKSEGWLLAVIRFIAKWIALNRTVDDKAVRAALVAKQDVQPK